MFFYLTSLQYFLLIMIESRSQELFNVERLNNEGEVDEALKIIINLEKEGELTPQDNLEFQILKGVLYFS